MSCETVLKVLLIFAMGATLLTLALGLFNMFRGGTFSNERSNKMMRLRVCLQAFAVLIFTFLLMLR